MKGWIMTEVGKNQFEDEKNLSEAEKNRSDVEKGKLKKIQG